MNCEELLYVAKLKRKLLGANLNYKLKEIIEEKTFTSA